MLPTELQTISFDEDSNTQSVYANFQVVGDSLNPVVVTKMLGIQPSRSWGKGEDYLGKELNLSSRKVREVQRKRPSGIWKLSSKGTVESKRAEEHLAYLLNLLEPKQALIEEYVKSPNQYIVKFYVHWEPQSESGSYELTQETLARMAHLCQYTEFYFL